MRRFRLAPLAVAVAAAFLTNQAFALPTGADIRAGQGAVTSPTAGSVVVRQDSARLAIDWQSFGIAAGESVRFVQPSASAIALNRVLGNSRSEIFGNLSANGQIFLLNANGVLFGRSAQVDVGGLVASTLDQRSFGRYITSETRSKGCPKICFTQYEFNVEEFLEKNRNREIMYSPIPENNPARLYEYLMELKANPTKKTKTISLSTTLMASSYSLIRHGFWFAAGSELLFYPMPTRHEMESKYYEWWRFVR